MWVGFSLRHELPKPPLLRHRLSVVVEAGYGDGVARKITKKNTCMESPQPLQHQNEGTGSAQALSAKPNTTFGMGALESKFLEEVSEDDCDSEPDEDEVEHMKGVDHDGHSTYERSTTMRSHISKWPGWSLMASWRVRRAPVQLSRHHSDGLCARVSVSTPCTFDVLFGGGNYNHPGNRRMLCFTEKYKEKYQLALDRSVKAAIVNQVYRKNKIIQGKTHSISRPPEGRHLCGSHTIEGVRQSKEYDA